MSLHLWNWIGLGLLGIIIRWIFEWNMPQMQAKPINLLIDVLLVPYVESWLARNIWLYSNNCTNDKAMQYCVLEDETICRNPWSPDDCSTLYRVLEFKILFWNNSINCTNDNNLVSTIIITILAASRSHRINEMLGCKMWLHYSSVCTIQWLSCLLCIPGRIGYLKKINILIAQMITTCCLPYVLYHQLTQ